MPQTASMFWVAVMGFAVAVATSVQGNTQLVLENLALRQQLAVLRCRVPRPKLRLLDRLFWVALSRLWPRWREALHLVTPATVIAWHRAGFRLFWRWRTRGGGRPTISAELQALVRRLSTDNPSWGAPRIHGELLKLGFRVAQSTIKAMGIEEVLSAPRSPWQNPDCERVIGTLRRELLDQVIILGERHAARLLREYVDYYNGSRTHLALDKDAPEPRALEPPSDQCTTPPCRANAYWLARRADPLAPLERPNTDSVAKSPIATSSTNVAQKRPLAIAA